MRNTATITATVTGNMFKPAKKNGKAISVDFDGVIHDYNKGWQNGEIYGDPIPGVHAALSKLVQQGFEIVICTTRLNPMFEEENRGIRDPGKQIRDWLMDNGLNYGYHWHEITNNKPKAFAYIDDRGIRFTNWSDITKYFC